MSELQNAATPASGSVSSADDPLSKLHRMSTTAGLGSTDYVAINPLAVTAFVLAVASSLVFLSWALLVIPIAALILAIIAVRQISDSNGTQGGKKLAIGAMALSLVLAGVVGAREIQRLMGAKEAQQQIAGLVQRFDSAMKDKNWGAAYELFSEDFRMRWPPDQFVARMNELVDSPRLGEFRSAAAGKNVILENTPTGRRGYSTITLDFSGLDAPSNVTAEYRLVGEQWQINDVQALFPPPEDVPVSR